MPHTVVVSLWISILLVVHQSSSSDIFSRSKRALNAKTYDGFQNLQPALIPKGVFIELPSHMSQSGYASIPNNGPPPPVPVFPSPVNPDAVPTSTKPTTIMTEEEFINALIADQLAQFQEPKSSSGDGLRLQANKAATQRFLAGIIPLRAVPMSMAMFIPSDATKTGKSTLAKSEAARKGVSQGVHKLILRIRKVAETAKHKGTFDYRRTFNGLSPSEAVFIPSGYFISLTSFAEQQGSSNGTSTVPASTLGSFSGIEALTAVPLNGGIFIPQKMNELPLNQMPPGFVPSEPAQGGIPDIPTFPPSKPDTTSTKAPSTPRPTPPKQSPVPTTSATTKPPTSVVPKPPTKPATGPTEPPFTE